MVTEAKLKKLLKESLREVLREERLGLYEILLPKVSKKEQKNIEELYGSPKDYNESEFVDMTDWIKK